MPDHIHLLTAPRERELSVAAFLKWFKRWFNELYGARGKWRWQPGGFDRLLRTSESVHESGTTFERIQFELVWSRTGASGHTRKVLPTTSRSWIGRGTLESCRAFVPNAMSLITNFDGV